MASLRLDTVQRHLQTLLEEGALGSLTDGELLERFISGRGESAEAAFSTLVERHAPMELATCRQLLGNDHDAQDASQAAFLVLARKARSIRIGQAIGGWLHAVAVRIASNERVAAARRRARERRGAMMANHDVNEPDRADRWAELHAQIDRLPERLRLPIVLCYRRLCTRCVNGPKDALDHGIPQSKAGDRVAPECRSHRDRGDGRAPAGFGESRAVLPGDYSAPGDASRRARGRTAGSRPDEDQARRPHSGSGWTAAPRGTAVAGVSGQRLDLVDSSTAGPSHRWARRAIRLDRLGQ
jgi:DNA-directed RNA polymerase specialized sigma24 family protein